MSDWTTAYYKGRRMVKQPVVRKPKTLNVEDELKNYADGRFANIDDAITNLFFNISGGMTVEYLTGYEIMMLEHKYGPDWRKIVFG